MPDIGAHWRCGCTFGRPKHGVRHRADSRCNTAIAVSTRLERVDAPGGIPGHPHLARGVLDKHTVGLKHGAESTACRGLHR